MATATDDFNRASLGSNWTQITGSGHSVTINSSVVAESAGNSSEAAAYWNADSFTASQRVWTQHSQTDPSGDAPNCGPVVLAATSGEDYYLLTIVKNSNAARVYRNNGGSYSQIGTDVSITWALDNWYGLETDGAGNFKVWEGTSIATATELATRTDGGTPRTSGQPGIWFFQQQGQINNWQAEDVGGGGGGIGLSVFGQQGIFGGAVIR